jgi:hypothetical protein
MRLYRGRLVLVLGVLLLWATGAAALSPADKCEADKLRRAGKYSFCRLKADAKAVKTGANLDAAKAVGDLLAKRAMAAGLKEVVFDRGGYLFHGRVKALADAAREGGLSF